MQSAIRLNSKNGIPNMKLRGVTEADFFQKNNTVEKGWTFNYDGTLSEFRKPNLQRELEEKVGYEVDDETVIKKVLDKRAGQQK